MCFGAGSSSFNPCFIGNPSATGSRWATWPSLWMFQSLFYWKSFCNWFLMTGIRDIKEGFNPCFIGNPSATKGSGRRCYQVVNSFNPCFIGNPSATTKTLWGIGNWNSFNPCFIGNPSATRKSAWRNRFWEGFNPCFIGNPSATNLPLMKPTFWNCFNPCFIGNPSATLQINIHKKSKYWFQSLFYWKSFCNSDFINTWCLPWLFQSLFYWKSFCNINQLFRERDIELEFQSLFYWKSFCNTNARKNNI